jgi:hypothetical protein
MHNFIGSLFTVGTLKYCIRKSEKINRSLYVGRSLFGVGYRLAQTRFAYALKICPNVSKKK